MTLLELAKRRIASYAPEIDTSEINRFERFAVAVAEALPKLRAAHVHQPSRRCALVDEMGVVVPLAKRGDLRCTCGADEDNATLDALSKMLND